MVPDIWRPPVYQGTQGIDRPDGSRGFNLSNDPVRVSEDFLNIDAASRKAKLRKEAALSRQKAFAAQGLAASQAILDNGLKLVSSLGHSPTVAAGYYPIRDELNSLLLLDALRLRGTETALPVALPGPALRFQAMDTGRATREGQVRFIGAKRGKYASQPGFCSGSASRIHSRWASPRLWWRIL